MPNINNAYIYIYIYISISSNIYIYIYLMIYLLGKQIYLTSTFKYVEFSSTKTLIYEKNSMIESYIQPKRAADSRPLRVSKTKAKRPN